MKNRYDRKRKESLLTNTENIKPKKTVAYRRSLVYGPAFLIPAAMTYAKRSQIHVIIIIVCFITQHLITNEESALIMCPPVQSSPY